MAFILAFSISILLLTCFQSLADRCGFVDRPNARSAHQTPTPVGAGICFAIAVIVALMVPSSFASENTWWFVVLQGCGLLVALVGLIDDRLSLPPWLRLFVYLVVAVVTVLTLLGVAPILVIGLAVLALGWTINLVNFMDGLDGLVVTQALCVCLGLAAISLFLPEKSGVAHLALLLVAALLPFLWLNWPPARIFMGDSGAVFLGFYLGWLGLYAAIEDYRLGAAWIILMMPFLTDATCTLLKRLAQGKSPAEAHSEHTYQRFKRAGGSALAINAGLLSLQIFWQLPLAFWAVFGSQPPIITVIFSTIPSLIAVAYGSRKP